MQVYKLTTTSGSYDDFHVINIGIYTSNELAEIAKQEFIDLVKKIIEDNPCPFDEETVYNIDNYINTSDEVYNEYTKWRYGKMYDIFELSLDARIEIINLDETNLNFLKERNYE